ncbi:hypothetical protein MCUN1_003803 [Malassezia cuniculi]|uniref:MARVEL domain-containing protein n=1 Tax=Malassezia cuniculi TaxID=948313 RepID=A0AAF0EZ63_9BASI|nr:hypothetical protein MCUN1_003803 [Malassezia cuniculi]
MIMHIGRNSTVVRRGHPIAFGVFTLIAFIVAVVSSAVVADFNKNGNPIDSIRDSTRFLVFAGWWGFIFSLVYIVLFLTGIGGPISSIASHAVFVFLTFIFWLAGTAALSDKVGTGCPEGTRNCSALLAIVAFGWIGFLELLFLLAVIGFLAFKAFRGGGGIHENF